MKTTLALLCAAALGLAGCNSATLNSDIDAFNTAINNDLPTACALIATANASFQAVVASGTISSQVVKEEAAAMAGVKTICANPGAVNASTALITLADAYAAVVDAARSQ